MSWSDGEIDDDLALVHAARAGDIKLVRKLLSMGADVSYRNDDEEEDDVPATALMAAASTAKVKCMKLLLEAGAPVNDCDSNHETALMTAVSRGKTKGIKLLLEAGADVNAFNWRGITVLSYAVESKRPDIIRLLVESGANVNGPDRCLPPLIDAANIDLAGCVDMLLSLGANARIVGHDGFTALHNTCSVDVAKNLLKHGANVDAVDNFGFTPLLRAANFDYRSIAETLLAHGANPSIKDKSGRYAWWKDNETGRIIKRAHRAKIARQRFKGIVRFLIVVRRYREDFYRHKYVTLGARSFHKKRKILGCKQVHSTKQNALVSPDLSCVSHS